MLGSSFEQLPLSKGELSEHLWLVARWFYSNPRSGEIFFREKNDWPYRRILRACSRLLAPPEPPKEPVRLNETAGLLYFAFMPNKLNEIKKLRVQR